MSEEPVCQQTFMEQYINGEVLAEDIDDFIDAWHRNPENKEIFEYLGMTMEEYSIWLRDPDVLPHVARARRANLDVVTVLRQSVDELPIAARSSDKLKVKRLLQWLEQRGKIY
jgi:DNA-directed RNA polymerase specialized sigma subunit